MPSNFTRLQLSQTQDPSGFQSMAYDVLIRSGYEFLILTGNLGVSDKGRDFYGQSGALFYIGACSINKNWRTKFREDEKTILKHNHKCNVLIFITNQDVNPNHLEQEAIRVKTENGWDLRIFDLNRLTSLIDLDRDIKYLHPGLFKIEVEKDTEQPVVIERIYSAKLPITKIQLNHINIGLTLFIFLLSILGIKYSSQNFITPIVTLAMVTSVSAIINSRRVIMFGKFIKVTSQQGEIKVATLMAACPKCSAKAILRFDSHSSRNYWICSEFPEDHVNFLDPSGLKYDDI